METIRFCWILRNQHPSWLCASWKLLHRKMFDYKMFCCYCCSYFMETNEFNVRTSSDWSYKLINLICGERYFEHRIIFKFGTKVATLSAKEVVLRYLKLDL